MFETYRGKSENGGKGWLKRREEGRWGGEGEREME